jgi:hypothetical protein
MLRLFLISGYIFIQKYVVKCVHLGEGVDPDIKEARNFLLVQFHFANNVLHANF